MMFWSSVFCDIRGKTQAEWLHQGVVLLRAELTVWERAYQATTKHKVTQIQKLLLAHFGGQSNRTLKLKAAENKYFFYCLHYKLESASAVNKVPQGQLWKVAADSLETFLRILEVSPWNMSTANIQELNCFAQRGIMVAATCIPLFGVRAPRNACQRT